MMSIEDIRKQEMLRVQAIISNFKTSTAQTQEVQKQESTIVKAEKEDIKKSVSDDDIQKAFDVLSSHYTDQGITKGEQTPAQKAKIEKVMKEFKEGTLKSSTGEKITDHKQALAIAMSEAGVSNKE